MSFEELVEEDKNHYPYHPLHPPLFELNNNLRDKEEQQLLCGVGNGNSDSNVLVGNIIYVNSNDTVTSHSVTKNILNWSVRICFITCVILTILTLLFILTGVITIPHMKTEDTGSANDPPIDLYELWRVKHDKIYETSAEEMRRFNVWRESLKNSANTSSQIRSQEHQMLEFEEFIQGDK